MPRPRKSSGGEGGLSSLINTGMVVPATSPDLAVERVSTGIPMLDSALGGGYAFGRNVMIVGPESTGKTALAQYAVAAVQRADPEGWGLLIDAEQSFDAGWWAATGVNLERLLVARPPTGEDAVELIISTIKDAPEVRVIVVDSIAALSPRTIQEKSSGERTIAGLAALTTNLYTRMLPINRRVLFIALNQLRANLAGYEDVWPGGWTLRHNSHIILRTRREGWIKENNERVGYILEVHVRKNKLGAPEATIQVPFYFQGQVDILGAYIDEAISRGVIESAGPYYRWRDNQFLGKQALRNFFAENADAFEALKSLISGE